MTANNNISHIPDTYWVVPNKFLAGPYPGGRTEYSTRSRVDELLELGICVFINLTMPGELDPYQDILETESKRYNKEAEHWNAPIEDFGVTTRKNMIQILDKIDLSLKKGKSAYVHCFGGIGRTGTVVGCYLARHGASGEGALSQIAEWRLSLSSGWVRAPESVVQREMVRNWNLGQ